MQVLVIRPAVGEPVNKPWIAVKGKNDRFVFREQRIEVMVTESMGMFLLILKFHEVHHIDDTDFQFRHVCAKEIDGG